MTVGHIYRSLSLGGMQRGAGSILKVHHDMGHDLVIFTREPVDGREYNVAVPFKRVVIGGGSHKKSAGAERLRLLREGIAAHGCDVVVHHEYYAASLPDDLRALEEIGVPAIVQWHGCFSALHMMEWWNGRIFGQLDAIRCHSRGVLALSRTDKEFFGMLGIPSVHVPYSDPDIFGGAVPEHPGGRGCEILWPSRMSMQKRPVDAVAVFGRVLDHCPGARLTMLGDGPERAAVEEWLAAHPRVAERVALPGFAVDVVPYFRAADLVLVTSAFEGFYHSIVEAKMAALPTVGYEMDYLDTTRPGTGWVSVPQGDVEAAAAAVCALLEDAAERRRLGTLARQDFERLLAIDQKALWNRAFEMAATPPGRFSAPPQDPALAAVVLDVLLHHVDASWRNSAERREAAERRRRRSFAYRLFSRLARGFAR